MCSQWLAIKLTCITRQKNMNCLALRPKNQNLKTEILDLQENIKCKNSRKVPFGSSKGPLQITKWHSITIVNPSCCKRMIHFSPKYSNGHSSDTGRKKKKKNCSINSHINTYLCQFMGQNSEIWEVKKIVELFDISKIGTFRPGKWPISDIFKNPNQGV